VMRRWRSFGPDMDLCIDNHHNTFRVSAPGAASSSHAFTVIDNML
jgi:hypothetical protein